MLRFFEIVFFNKMLDKIVIILLILLSTPCFSEDRIYSYTDENGNKVYTSEKKSPAPPQKPQYHSSGYFEYRPDTIMQRKGSVFNNQNRSIPANPLVSNKDQVSVSAPQNAHLTQPKRLTPSINSRTIIGSILLQITFMFIAGITFLIFWLVALIDILKNEFTGSNKIIWLLAIILVAPIGTILYFIIGKKQKIGHQESSANQELCIRTYNKPKI